MHPEAYSMLARRAEVYWWHRARRWMSLALLQRAGLDPGCRWLDLGCGPGGNLQLLESLQPVLAVGLDLSPLALGLAQRSGKSAALVRANIAQGLPFADQSFDVVTIFNVLYHQWVVSESTVLGEVARVLRHRGLLLLTEPAFPLLMREMDAIGMGRKRYRLAEMKRICLTEGLDVVRGSYFTSFGFPVLLGLKALRRPARGAHERATALTADMKSLPPAVNGFLYLAAKVEAGLIARGMPIPCGTTLVCLARRP